MRIVWIIVGLLALVIGMIGIFLPILPTVPFLLLATFCFARSSKKLHDWLVYHPILGPPILNWQEKGIIHRYAKIYASISIAAAFILSITLEIKISFLLIQAVVLCSALIFIWSRPES